MKKMLVVMSLFLFSLTVTGMAIQTSDIAKGYTIHLVKNGRVLGTMPMDTEQREVLLALRKTISSKPEVSVMNNGRLMTFIDHSENDVMTKEKCHPGQQHEHQSIRDSEWLTERFERLINDSVKGIDFDELVILSPKIDTNMPNCLKRYGMFFPVR